jgi:hypothetical protein
LIKARSKKLSILLVLAMLMTMFVGLGTASAGNVDYSVVGGGTIKTGNNQVIGKIIVSIPEVSVLDVYSAGGEFLSVSLPLGIKFNDSAGVNNIVEIDTNKIKYSTGYLNNITSDRRTLNIKVGRVSGATGDTKIIITLKVDVKDASGDVAVLIGGPAGSIFPQTSLTIGKTVSSGSTTTFAKSVKTFGDGGGAIDDIIIMENVKGSFEFGNDKYITLKLNSGFTWKDEVNAEKVAAAVYGDWGLPQSYMPQITTSLDGTSRELKIRLATPSNYTGAARLVIKGLDIKVESDAKFGDIIVNVSGAGVTDQDVVVAKYGEYAVKVYEDATKELIAGKNEQKIGSFYIEEVIPGSLVSGRTLYIDLPAGVKWFAKPTVTVKSGDNVLSPGEIINKDRTLKYTITGSTSKAAKLLLESAKVYVEPGFSGPINLEISGTAGAKGTVKVAEVKPAVELKAENVANVIIGSQDQKVADILIKETAKEAINSEKDKNNIVIGLDAGFKFAKKPVVSVVEGDLEIDTTKLNSSNDQLTITIKYSSTKPSTIKISDVYLTGFRSAPEGPVRAYLIEAEGEIGKGTGSTALDEGFGGKFSEVSAGKVVIANCVTPAEGAGTATFKVGSNIYYVGGNAKVMDVAPYIKDSRTYVPMRYLGEILGAEVVWNDAARTVTLTKGKDVVVFTIGSTTYTVNGEAKTADVAPEITNSRTMLPARFVAEAFGAQVGWDAGTQTVLIQQ